MNIKLKNGDTTVIINIILGDAVMKHDEIPIGFSMALAQNPEAIKKFSMMSENRKQEIIAGIHSVKSKEEMHQYVNQLIYEN